MEKKIGLKRQKKMSSALLSLSRSVQELTEENQSLKEDLDRVLSNSPTFSKIKGDYFPRGWAGGGAGDAPGEGSSLPLSGGRCPARSQPPRPFSTGHWTAQLCSVSQTLGPAVCPALF